MIWNELKKTWKRPVIIAAFLFIIIYQFSQVWHCKGWLGEFNFNSGYKEAYKKYSGIMDENWKRKIKTEYEKNNSNTDTDKNSKDFSILTMANAYCDLDNIIRQYIKFEQSSIAASDSGFDLNRVETAYKKLRKNLSKQQFDTKVTMNIFTSCLPRMRNCIILFLVLLLATLFTSEEETGMDNILFTCKHGRVSLYFAKFIVCQISAIIVWFCINISTIIAIRVMTGGIYGLDGIIQDFLTNASPFVWDEKTYLGIINLMGIITALLISFVLFLIAAKSKNSISAIIVSLIIIFLPTIIKDYLPNFKLIFPNFLAGDFLWNHYSERRIGNFYISDWQVAITEIIFLFIISGMLCYSFRSKAHR